MPNNISGLCGRSLPSGIVRPCKQGPGSGKYDFKSYGQFFSVLCGSESPNQILLRTHRRSSKEAVKRRMCLQIVCTQKKEEVTIFVVTSFSVWEHRDSNPGPSACKAEAFHLEQFLFTYIYCTNTCISSINIKIVFLLFLSFPIYFIYLFANCLYTIRICKQ